MALNIFGWSLFSKQEISAMAKEAPRPTRGFGLSDQKKMEVIWQPVLIAELYDWAYYSDTYRTIINARQREIFRNKAEWKPKFVKKCEVCGIESETDVEKCTECGSKVRGPNKTQLTLVKPFFECCNQNGQSMLDVFTTQSPDFDVADNAYLVFLSKYFYDENGGISSAQPLEVIRGDPLYMRKIIDRQGRLGHDYSSGKPVMICPEHRTRMQDIKNKVCDVTSCRRRLYPAHYYSVGDTTTYYLPGEVLHKTMYTATLYYGFPMALTIMTKVRCLMAMDVFMMQYYNGMKTPKGLVAIRTTNPDSASASWDNFLNNVANDPHGIYPFFVPNTGMEGSDKLVEYVDFMRTLQEMQYSEARTEMINRVGAPFGVSPIFQADLSTSGGLNNEGLQITITTRAVESAHETYNSESRWVSEHFGITDWEYQLNPPEEKDEMAELQREYQKAVNAEIAQRMGFEVSRTPEGDYKVSDKPTSTQDGGASNPPTSPPETSSRPDGMPEASRG